MDATSIIRTYTVRLVCFMLPDSGDWKYVKSLPNMAAICYTKTKAESRHLTMPKFRDTKKSLIFSTNSSIKQRKSNNKNRLATPAWTKKRKKKSLRETNILSLIVMKTVKLSSWHPNNWSSSRRPANWMRISLRFCATPNLLRGKLREETKRNFKRQRWR